MAYSNSYILFLLGVSVILSSQVLAYNRPSESSLNYGEELDEQKGLDYVNAPKMNEELEAKKGMDYVNAPKIVSYEMPLEDTTYVAYEMPLEHTSSSSAEINDGGLDYIKVPRTDEVIEEHSKDVDYVKAPKNVAYEMPLEHTSYSDINDEKFDNQKVLDFVKSPKTAAYEMPPESPTYPEINANLDEALNDQKGEDSLSAQKIDEKFDDNQKSIDSVESVNVPKIDEKFDDNQNGVDSVKASKIDEKLDDEKDVDSSKFSKIDETLNDQKGVDWVSFHARYPWIKKNSLTTGSRKLLLNHIANDQSA
ncbi:nodulin-25 [Lathyrus oleraceus]|uniref:nodulin-25 n=1 Tax=Pisum sativum TaxID=3888 RepID=UPI0021D0E666|nr:nodulin-25-like [Pisum sativum]